MYLNRNFLYIAVLAFVCSGCNFNAVEYKRPDREPRIPDYITLSGTVDLDIGGGRRPGDRIGICFNEADINKADGVLMPSIPSSVIGANGEWEIGGWLQGIKPFTGQKRIYFVIMPEAGGRNADENTYNTADSGSDLLITNRGTIVAVKSMDITGNNRDISNINLGRIVIDTVRITGTWREPTKRFDQVFANIAFYSDAECTQPVFYPGLHYLEITDEWEMLTPKYPEGRTLYVGLDWTYNPVVSNNYKTFPTGESFSTANTGPIVLPSFDITDKY